MNFLHIKCNTAPNIRLPQDGGKCSFPPIWVLVNTSVKYLDEPKWRSVAALAV